MEANMQNQTQTTSQIDVDAIVLQARIERSRYLREMMSNAWQRTRRQRPRIAPLAKQTPPLYSETSRK